MKTANWILQGFLIATALTPAAFAEDLAETARQAAAGDAAAVKVLRGAGPAGMEALLKLAEIKQSSFDDALDAVCAQKDCAASHLYWYTDLAAAREAARKSGKPILSLRLLGRLDEELSCANSRFFRAVLYANEQVSRELRARFVLHWQSERPVPKVTIDFGDGRRLVGTVTGNSIHYILDSNGRLVDALPGLYGPAAFLHLLREAGDQARALASASGEPFLSGLRKYHRMRLSAQRQELEADIHQAGIVESEAAGGAKPAAIAASRLAVSKSTVEIPLLKALLPVDGDVETAMIARLAGLHPEASHLDAASRRVLIAKGGAWVNGDEGAIGRFEAKIAEDTVRNEYLFHNQIHSWLARQRETADLEGFNARVYARLFLTPASDPWLGLGPQEVFSVLTPAGE